MRGSARLGTWIGIGFMSVTAGGLLTLAVLEWQANRRLGRQTAAIRAAGEPLHLVDLQGKPGEPGDNAVTFLRQAERDVSAVAAQLTPAMNDGPYRENGNLNARGAALVRTTLAACPPLAARLEQAAGCGHYDPLYDFSVPPVVVQTAVMQSVQQLRSAVRIMVLRAELELFNGRRDEALRLAVLALQLARCAEREPLLVGFTATLGARSAALDKINPILAGGPVAPEVRRILEDELARQDAMEGFTWAVQSERALNTDQFAVLFNRDAPPLWFTTQWKAEALEMMSAELEMGPSPRYLLADELAAQKAQISNVALNQPLHGALTACRNAMDRVRAAARCLQLLSRFQERAIETGSDALRLDELGLDDARTRDPFTGEPMLTSSTPDGWIIYSAGPNGADDGGRQNAGADDIRVGPWEPPSAKDPGS